VNNCPNQNNILPLFFHPSRIGRLHPWQGKIVQLDQWVEKHMKLSIQERKILQDQISRISISGTWPGMNPKNEDPDAF
jgi:hypothetical protein